jgi:hypothetical protein
MKISKKFPHVKEDNAFVIVAGKQDAAFYRIEGGNIERVDAFKIPRPKYSDNEGNFKVRQKGKTVSTGARLEIDDRDVIKEFLRELKSRLKSQPSNFNKLYLFVPSPYKNDVRKTLPAEWQKKDRSEIMGNYYYRNAAYLVEKMESAGAVK